MQSQQSRIEPSDTRKQQAAGRVLIAGEFANNWGHLGCMLAMARAYRAAGHEVVLAVSDLNAARFFFAADDFPLLQAPVILITQHPAPHQGEAFNFVGGAFDIPPTLTPLPIFREAADPSAQKLAMLREAEVTENINSLLSRFQLPTLKFLEKLFSAEQVRLTTLPELDPFGSRLQEQYVGPIFALPTFHRVGWKSTGVGTRIFAYLHPQVPACERLLEVINSLEAEVLCVMPGCPPQWPARFDCITFHTQPLELAFLHLVITSGVATTTTALLIGLPILSVPRTLEQHLVAHALERTGAAKTVEGSASLESIASDIGELLGKTNYRRAAVRIAMKYFAVQFENNAQLLVDGMK